MIHNPPFIVLLLKSYTAAKRLGYHKESEPLVLARLFIRTIGHQPYGMFLKTYQLYLQSIPLEIAKAAWGINAAEASLTTTSQHK